MTTPRRSSPSHPTGVVTFLFTDVEGSTQLWEQFPDEMNRALELHDEVLGSAIARRDGYVFSSAGDSFAAAFADPHDAIGAACEAQHGLETAAWPSGVRIIVRMGVHTGTSNERGGDYFGPEVNRAARIMSAGHGRQILLSAAAAEQVGADDLVDLGAHRLKDLGAPEQIFQVARPDVEFASLRTLDEIPGNIPVYATSFVGRSADVDELSSLIRDHRLVTLTGVGGVGKTRLAVQTAAESANHFPDGAWLVELAAITDPSSLPDAMASTLGVSTSGGPSATGDIVRALSGRKMLLILDNCEHVVEAAAELTDAIVRSTSRISLLATSREGLGTAAEREWPVSPLAVEGGAESAASELFVERAKAVNMAFDPAAAPGAVSEICRRLDGIALAIELAAARMTSMTVEEIRGHLDDRFRLLADSRRGRSRHQTLRETVGWSYDRLDVDEQQLLEQIAVFSDGFTLQAVSAMSPAIDEFAVLDGLDSLIRKSLLVLDWSSSPRRYRLLETIREYARERLEAHGDLDATRSRHARYFAGQVVDCWETWDGSGYRAAVDWVDTEYANLRAAFRYAVEAGSDAEGDVDVAATIAAHTSLLGQSLQRFESVSWAEEVLPRSIRAQVRYLSRLYVAASLCLFRGRAADAVEYARQAMEGPLGVEPDVMAQDVARYRLASAHHFEGRLEVALDTLDGLDDHSPMQVAGLCLRSQLLAKLGRFDEAMEVADRSLELAELRENPFWISFALHSVGLAYRSSDPTHALDAFRRGVQYASAHRVPHFGTIMAINMARIEATHGDPAVGANVLSEAIDALDRCGDVANMTFALGTASTVVYKVGDARAAAILLGAMGGYNNVGHVPDGFEDWLRDDLGEQVFDDAMKAGSAMDLTTSQRFALEYLGHTE